MNDPNLKVFDVHGKKMMIRELIEERRPLTLEEYLIIASKDHIKSNDSLRSDAQKYLDEIGFISTSPRQIDDAFSKYGMGIFRLPLLRVPTTDEINAYYFLERFIQYAYLGINVIRFPQKEKEYTKLLDGKEVVFVDNKKENVRGANEIA